MRTQGSTFPGCAKHPVRLNPGDLSEARGQDHACLGQFKHGLQGRDVLDKVVLHVSIQSEVGQALCCPSPGTGVYRLIAQPPGGGEGACWGRVPGPRSGMKSFQGSRQQVRGLASTRAHTKEEMVGLRKRDLLTCDTVWPASLSTLQQTA